MCVCVCVCASGVCQCACVCVITSWFQRFILTHVRVCVCVCVRACVHFVVSCICLDTLMCVCEYMHEFVFGACVLYVCIAWTFH